MLPSAPASESLVLERASIIRTVLFDVGDELVLERAEALLSAGEPTQRLRLSRTGADSLAIKSLPLDVGLEPAEVELEGGQRLKRTSTRLYDYGTVAVRYRYQIQPGATLAELLPLLSELYDSPRPQADARAVVDALLPRLGDALLRGALRPSAMVYTVIYVEAFAGHPTAAEVLGQRDVLAKLLQGEVAERPMAAGELVERLRCAFSYLDDDLVLVDSEVAFVLEPTGTEDVVDVLEFAAAHLINLRSYDELLDQELERIFDDVFGVRSPKRLLWSPYGPLVRQVQRRWLEITEVTERLDNSVKVVGDAYLARVYRGAVERFGIPLWRDAVLRKQSRVAQMYELFMGQLETRRTMLLELAIVILIVLEIVLFFDTK